MKTLVINFNTVIRMEVSFAVVQINVCSWKLECVLSIISNLAFSYGCNFTTTSTSAHKGHIKHTFKVSKRCFSLHCPTYKVKWNYSLEFLFISFVLLSHCVFFAWLWISGVVLYNTYWKAECDSRKYDFPHMKNIQETW